MEIQTTTFSIIILHKLRIKKLIKSILLKQNQIVILANEGSKHIQWGILQQKKQIWKIKPIQIQKKIKDNLHKCIRFTIMIR